jgi:transcription antitermination factor NusG
MVNKSWLVIKYNLLNEARLVNNLNNQKFTYYFPKVLVKKNNQTKLLNLFPGYAFVQYDENKIHALNYTKGLQHVLKSGVEYSLLDNAYINEIKEMQESLKKLSLEPILKLNSEALISAGPLKGKLIKIIGYKTQDRISFMYNLLGRNFVSDIEIENLKF